jgi:hypothetical protein
VAEQARRIIIDARVGDGAISGSARNEFGEPKPFQGWLELLAALDALLDASRHPTTVRTRPGTSEGKS